MAHLLEPYSSCDVSDALTKLDIPGYLLDIVPFSDSSKIIGPAYTVEYSSSATDKPSKHPVDDVPPGSIIVIKAPSTPNAVWGGLMTARAKYLNVKGAVIEGRFRDLDEICDMRFGVWAKARSTLGAQSYCKLKSVGEPIVIGEGIYPVLINQGDIIVADRDGVVRIPVDKVEQVVEYCRKRTAMDQKCMDDIKNGSTIVQAFALHRK